MHQVKVALQRGQKAKHVAHVGKTWKEKRHDSGQDGAHQRPLTLRKHAFTSLHVLVPAQRGETKQPDDDGQCRQREQGEKQGTDLLRLQRD